MNVKRDPAAARIVEEFAADRSRLLDIVEAVQRRSGYVSNEAVQTIASGVGIHPVEVEDMLTFYAFFDRQPRGRNRIRLSKTPISFMKGAKEVARAFEDALGISVGGTSADGVFTLQWTSDIGMADQEPSAIVNGMILTALAPGDVLQIVATLRRQAVPPNATVRSSLVQPGPILSGLTGRGEGIKAALALPPDRVIEEVTNAKLRGRGGAGFPTGMKWRFTRKAPGDEHYVVCNADEGEPGTFKDRVLLSEFSDLVFDGMTVAGYALGARHGLVYLRGEYAYMWNDLQEVLKTRRHLGLLGDNICGRKGFDFDIRIQLGAGAYICGEEFGAARIPRGQAGRSARSAAVSDRARLPPTTDCHRQCRNVRLRGTHHRERGRLVHRVRHTRLNRHEADERLGRLRASRRL